MMKQYKAIFFDWDDTIGDFSNAALRSLRWMYEHRGLNSCYDSFERFFEVYEAHNLDLWARYGLDQVTKEYLEFDRMFYPLTQSDHPFPLKEEVRLAQKMADDHLRLTTRFFSLLPDADEVIRYLAKKYPLVVVSNGFRSVQYSKIERSGLSDCFRYVVLSEEVGCQKPNPKIYQTALDLGGWKADEVLMIGDSWTSDIQGAIAAGIDQLWITDAEPSADQPSTYRVPKLRDVMTML